MSERDHRFPIGKFQRPSGPLDDHVRSALVGDIERLPSEMRAAVDGMTDEQLDTPYRPEGWTVRQVVHHVGDSHMNGFTRVKLTLTEDTPTIKAYDEKAFAELGDMRLPIGVSLDLLTALHARWVAVYAGMRDAQFQRTFSHPDYPDPPQTLDRHAQMYSWHSRHHVAHITALRTREGW